MKIENRQKLLMIVAISMVGLWAANLMIVSPLERSWKTRSARIAELRRSVAQGTQLLEREAVIRSRWRAMDTSDWPLIISMTIEGVPSS